jgi:hypothetical protein
VLINTILRQQLHWALTGQNATTMVVVEIVILLACDQ